MENKRRLEVLDAFRGLAALFVVLYHYTYRYYIIYPQENELFMSFSYGHYGVEAFFIISGFVIFMTLSKMSKANDFVVHRFIRLFPTYWISVFFTFIVVSIFPLPNREVSWIELLENLTMVHTQFGVNSVDGVYWTLLYELKFYFLIFMIYIFRKLNYIEVFSLLLLTVILGINITGYENKIIDSILSQIFIAKYISFFISGIMFYKIYSNNKSILILSTLFLAFITSVVLNGYDGVYILLMIYCLFALMSLHKLKFFSTKPLVFLGSISYALYLIHQNLGYIILNYGNSLGINVLYSLLTALMISIVIATIITYIFEKRIIRYLKVIYEKYEARHV